MTRYVAFLRSINTPPRHVKMARLRGTFIRLGFENVATYIASGNVIFDTGDPSEPTTRRSMRTVPGLARAHLNWQATTPPKDDIA